MKVCVSRLPQPDRALSRVVAALEASAPAGVTCVSKAKDADLVVLHVIGRRQRTEADIRTIREQGQRYAVMQYVLRSTLEPECSAWIDIWRGAAAVWSYLHLAEACRADGVPMDFAFYHAPLGVDPAVFYPDPSVPRTCMLTTCGRDWLTEGVREGVHATQAVGVGVQHLGSRLRHPDVPCFVDIPDSEVADLYRRSRYVSGLRRVEGFELPAAEGLLCGARPVLFDRPHYRQWYGDWAAYIAERPRPQVQASLIDLFRSDYRPVTPEEHAAAVERFSWPRVCRGFWERLCQ